jgi:hypothetical protein
MPRIKNLKTKSINELVESVSEKPEEVKVEDVKVNTDDVKEIKEEIIQVIDETTKVMEKAIKENPIEKIEETAEKIINKNKSTLIDLIKEKIMGKDNDISFTINEKVIQIINIVIDKCPESLNKITDNIKDILSDGVLDQKDIPKILVLITNLYNTDFKSVMNNISIDTNDVVEFLKTIIKLTVEFDLVTVNNKNDIYEMVETSGTLLQLVIPSPTNQIDTNMRSCACLPILSLFLGKK